MFVIASLRDRLLMLGSGALSEGAVAGLLEIAARMAGRWCPSAFDTQDIAQEAVMRLLAQRRQPDNAITWLFVVVRRLSHRRTIRERSRVEAESAYANAQRAEERQVDLLIEMRSVLSHLPERQRVLLLCVAEGWHTRELADVFGCAPGNIGTMVARARLKARQVGLRERQKRR